MAVNTYIPRIALIIDGKRYPAGEAIDLTDEQYAQVAAYVDPFSDAAADTATNSNQPDGVTPLEDEKPDDESEQKKSTRKTPPKK